MWQFKRILTLWDWNGLRQCLYFLVKSHKLKGIKEMGLGTWRGASLLFRFLFFLFPQCCPEGHEAATWGVVLEEPGTWPFPSQRPVGGRCPERVPSLSQETDCELRPSCPIQTGGWHLRNLHLWNFSERLGLGTVSRALTTWGGLWYIKQ